MVVIVKDCCYHFIFVYFDASKNYLFDAVNCPDGNPFNILRLGKSLLLGKVNKVKEYLLRAFILEGYAIFIVKRINILM
jgi:hypothetical protein